MTRVLIAVGANDGVEVAKAARRLFGDEADYMAVNCTEVSGPFGVVYRLDEIAHGLSPEPPMIAPGQARTEAIDVAIERADRVATDAGLANAEAIGEVGDPVSAIMRAAKELDADVIVVGSHGRSWFSRLFESSVADGVKREADIPVLFVQSVAE